MSPTKAQEQGFVRVAVVEVEAVRPRPQGFILDGRGADRADYRLELEFEMPLDPRTRSVLGELLTQSEWKLSRRVRESPRKQRNVTRTRI
jgi:hypothetical protein